MKPSHLRDLISYQESFFLSSIKSLSDSNYKFSKALEVSSGLCEKEVINLFCDQSFSRRLRAMLATLLNTYTRCYQKINKAEAIFEKMGELGFLSRLCLFKLMGT